MLIDRIIENGCPTSMVYAVHIAGPSIDPEKVYWPPSTYDLYFMIFYERVCIPPWDAITKLSC